MSRIRTITRRSFLVASAALAGGVAFGAYVAGRPHDNPLAEGLGEEAATFNPWVLVRPDGITLIGPHADLGQGVASSQALLIAEEMDLEFGQFETSFGSPSAAYWNTAMASDAVPFRPTDEGYVAESARSVVGTLLKVMGMQGTGGSTTMPDSFDKLRQAGASARETLKLAASQRTGVPVEELATRSGNVILPDGTEIAFTDLAAEASAIDPVQNVPLRPPSAWRLIGKPMQRLDIVAKSTGTQDYGIDLDIDGMVYAAIRVNPRQGGAIEGYDASAARAMSGVTDVVDITGGIAVIAGNTWTAIKAAEAVDITWGAAPYPAEQAAHWEALGQSFTDELLDSTLRDDGDASGLVEAGEAISAEYRVPYVAHAPLEPLNAVVRVQEAGVDVWTGHQIPRQLQVLIGDITGHDPEAVRFHNQYAGGSFGHRLEFEFVKQAAEIANQMRGTPVKLTYSREEDFAHDFPRQIAMGRGRGTVKDGRIEAIDLDIASPSVFASQMGRANIPVPGPDAQIVAGSWNNPYKLDGFRVRGFRAPELAPISSWRSVGASHAGFILDSFIDELAHAAGADPLEERIRMMDHDVSRKVLEAVGEMSSWGSALPEGRGRGVAFVESFGVPVAEVVEVTATPQGIRLDKVWVAADVGTVIDPVNFENLVQGGVVWALGHAMNCEITYSDGMAEQSNYHAHEGMRLYQCPEIFVRGLENSDHVRGIGEPPVPPAAPALANAIFAATGQRLREMPFDKHVRFV